MSDTKFTVSMHPTLVDALDEGFSPMDGLVAIGQMFGELPLLHQTLAPKRLRKRAGSRLKVYRGCYDWYSSLGFSYVQIATTLHVLDLWYDDSKTRRKVDVILGQEAGGYDPFKTESNAFATVDDLPDERNTITDSTSLSTRHTPAPWAYKMDSLVSHILAPDSTGENPHGTYIAEVANGDEVGPFFSYEQNEANARRIVAAVNACEGIGTLALEAGLVRQLLKSK